MGNPGVDCDFLSSYFDQRLFGAEMKVKFNPFRKAWDIFRERGVENLSLVQYEASANFNMMKHLLTAEETQKIYAARGRALIGQGREEFDSLCREIDKRLWGGK